MTKPADPENTDADGASADGSGATPRVLNEPFILETPPATSVDADEPIFMATKPVAKRSGGGAFTLLLGGALAVAAGFGLAKYQPNGWPLQDISGLEAKLAEQDKVIANLQGRLGANASPADLEARIAVLEKAQGGGAEVQDALSSLADRLTKLEARPQGAAPDPAALKALQDQIDALANGTSASPQALADAEAKTKEAEARAAEVQAQAEAEARKASQIAALAEVERAIEAGAPYAQALQALPDSPTALSSSAEAGVQTLASLQAQFPDAARAALDAALRANMGSSWSDRVGAFLKTQTGARSLVPRDGTDPDAILSRAEAALGRNDIPAALTELDALPEAAKGPMQTWRAMAEQRLAVTSALAEMKTALGQ